MSQQTVDILVGKRSMTPKMLLSRKLNKFVYLALGGGGAARAENSGKKLIPHWETSSPFSGLPNMACGLPKWNSGDRGGHFQ